LNCYLYVRRKRRDSAYGERTAWFVCYTVWNGPCELSGSNSPLRCAIYAYNCKGHKNFELYVLRYFVIFLKTVLQMSSDYTTYYINLQG
jgi:hypothetical protein